MRYISRGFLKMEIIGNLSQPLHDIWTHAVGYYKYNTYTKYTIDLWENMCNFLSGKSRSYLLQWTLVKIQRYTNLVHACPYEGLIYIKAKNFSIHTIPVEPLIPSGRYRLDINVTDGSRKLLVFSGKLFFSVSDHRIEQV